VSVKCDETGDVYRKLQKKDWQKHSASCFLLSWPCPVWELFSEADFALKLWVQTPVEFKEICE